MNKEEFTKPSQYSNDNRSLTWYLICRTAVITFLLGGAALFYLKGSLQHRIIPPLFFLIGVSYAEALISAFLLKRLVRRNLFTQVQIVWDLIFVSVLILLTGGVESVFSFAYLLVIIPASFLLSRRLTILCAASATILFGGMLDLQYFSYLHDFNLFRSVPAGTFLSVLFVHSVAFFLTAILSGTLAERWRRSEKQLQEKTIDYAELERMNRTILAHISSGLLLVNPEGKIRSFNRAASDITGWSLQEVYDQEVSNFFPEMAFAFAPGARLLSRAEGQFYNKNGDQMTLGFATTIARGSQGEYLGTLVTFQDLTQFKKIEEDLKRADRLAVVGRLAAGMAHEIRNPLASISGSVQMLLEADHIQKEDHRLMTIVVNEAERLNGLLTDFLNFARPNPLQKSVVELVRTIDDFIEILRADSRFDDIDIQWNPPRETVSLELDSGQFQQVLWDLAINSAEAMGYSGQLRISLAADKSGIISIIMEDTGPGIPDDQKNQIFEPFFSTKDFGSGLGLATVYSIIDMHGGKVRVERSPLGGACFIVEFLEKGS